MATKCLFAFTLIAAQSFAQVENRATKDLQEVGPESATPQNIDQQTPVAPNPQVTQVATNPNIISAPKDYRIRGLMLIRGDIHHLKAARTPGITLDLGESAPPTLQQDLEPFLGGSLDRGILGEVKKAILKAYKEEEQEYVIALIPEQNISDGIIVIQILEGTAGNITFIGQNWTPKSNLINKIDLHRGDPVDQDRLLENLAWVNRNPFHSSQMIFSSGKQKDRIDVEFLTHDRFPVRPFIGSDNTGIRSNSQTRIFAGFNWGNAFMRDDIFTFQYTASPGFHRFQSYVGNYTAFINSQHNILEVFATYAQIFPVIPGIRVEGLNAQGSLRYQILSKPLASNYTGFWELGFDYKWQTSSLFFEGTLAEAAAPNPSQILALNQLVLGYSLRKQFLTHSLTFKGEMFASIWKDMFPHQTSRDYELSRPFSKVRYAYWQIACSDQWQFAKDWFFSALFRGQVGSGTLPASEEYGLGGEDTVRGYYEQQFTADNVAILNLEIYAPSFTLFKKLKDTVHILAFFDWAYGYNYHASPQFKRANLAGIGPGLRYDIVPYFHFQVDYGFQLITIPGGSLFGRFQLAGNLSY